MLVRGSPIVWLGVCSTSFYLHTFRSSEYFPFVFFPDIFSFFFPRTFLRNYLFQVSSLPLTPSPPSPPYPCVLSLYIRGFRDRPHALQRGGAHSRRD